jgi:hypothetical protein
VLQSIGTLAIQQLTRSLDEESDSLTLYQFDLKLKSSRHMLLKQHIMSQNSWQCKVAASLWHGMESG